LAGELAVLETRLSGLDMGFATHRRDFRERIAESEKRIGWRHDLDRIGVDLAQRALSSFHRMRAHTSLQVLGSNILLRPAERSGCKQLAQHPLETRHYARRAL